MTNTNDDNHDRPPLDPERLQELQDSLGVDASELKDVILLRYITTVSDGLPLLSSLLAANDALGFRQKSHQLKGSSLNSGPNLWRRFLWVWKRGGKRGYFHAQPELDRAALEFSRLRGYIESGAFMTPSGTQGV
ncbi:MAG: hypothetical protein IPN90_00225 [Elusimicrobia bacterium]|nr:hypothetical protein [Elusimicrobiota bacterium]